MPACTLSLRPRAVSRRASQAELEKKRRQKARLAELAEAEASKRADQEAMDVAQQAVGPAVDAWADAAGVVKKVKRGMAAPNYARVLRALLATLHTVPNVHVDPIKLASDASGGALKKAYFKVRYRTTRPGVLLSQLTRRQHPGLHTGCEDCAPRQDPVWCQCRGAPGGSTGVRGAVGGLRSVQAVAGAPCSEPSNLSLL